MKNQQHLDALIEIAKKSTNKDSLLRRASAYASKHGLTMPSGVVAKAVDEGDLVHKGFNPIGKSWAKIEKATVNEDGSINIEGWVSTPDEDLEKDIAEPEAFFGDTFESYFERNAPISSNHNTDALPVGHMQKGILVRDGVIFQEEVHPTDPADFAHYDATVKGTGWYGRGVINEPRSVTSINKGNVGGFSWIGNLREYEKTANGGRRFHMINPLLESTIAAYPVNTKAVMRIAKAHGLEGTNTDMDEQMLETLLAGAIEKINAKNEAARATKGLTKEDVVALLAEQATQTATLIDEKVSAVQKAQAEELRKGQGRKGTIAGGNDGSETEREANPIAYIAKKARDPKTYDQTDKQLVWALTHKALTKGMSQDNTPDDLDVEL